MHYILKEFLNFSEKMSLIKRAFIVGGAVRDMILGKETKDLDIAIKGNAIDIAKEFAHIIDGSFVLLDEKFGVARIVKNNYCIDISQLRGDSIYYDLSERDLTINSMAIPLIVLKSYLSNIKPFIIDPYNGERDLYNRTIRIVSEDNLMKDPLRILRIYRFAGTLGFSIDEKTRNSAKGLSYLIKSVAVERITEELKYIIALDNSYKTILLLHDDGILKHIFYECGDIAQRLKLYKNVEVCLNDPNLSPIHSQFSGQAFKKICLKLSTLFSEPEIAKSSAIRLRLSKKEVEFIYKMSLNKNRILDLYLYKKGIKNSGKEVLSILKEFKDDIYPLLILTISNNQDSISFCLEIYTYYNNIFKQRMGLLPLITGDDLIKEFNLKPSPIFKDLLNIVEDMVLEGRISLKDEALSVVRDIISKQSN